MPTNVIVNGSFDVNPGSPGFGWSGTDLETTYSEAVYQGNGNTGNSVAEMNGGANQTTVMKQTFTVAAGQTTDLVLDAAIRNSPNAVAGTDGFTVKITNAAGTDIFSDTILPTTVAFQVFTFPVTFPAAGDYTLTFTEVGGANSYGALIDDIELMVCLTADSLVDTPNGPVAVQDLRVGMPVDTLDGPKLMRWIAHKTVSAKDMAHNDKLRPVLIRADSLGVGIPARDMQVSRQHRMLVSSAIAERMFGIRDVLIPAIRLTALPGIDVIDPQTSVTYFHILFDTHSRHHSRWCPYRKPVCGTIRLQGAVTCRPPRNRNALSAGRSPDFRSTQTNHANRAPP
jgi:hypothetical protein